MLFGLTDKLCFYRLNKHFQKLFSIKRHSHWYDYGLYLGQGLQTYISSTDDTSKFGWSAHTSQALYTMDTVAFQTPVQTNLQLWPAVLLTSIRGRKRCRQQNEEQTSKFNWNQKSCCTKSVLSGRDVKHLGRHPVAIENCTVRGL